MNHIRISKTPIPRRYTVIKDGKPVGAIYLNLSWSHWIVEDERECPVSRHTTIKAAVRTAKRVLA